MARIAHEAKPQTRPSRWARAVLPFATAIIWWLASWLLARLDILTPMPPAGRFQQALILGVSSYLLWKFPLGGILVLHLLNSYVYFGQHPFWKYVSATAQTILRPLEVRCGYTKWILRRWWGWA